MHQLFLMASYFAQPGRERLLEQFKIYSSRHPASHPHGNNGALGFNRFVSLLEVECETPELAYPEMFRQMRSAPHLAWILMLTQGEVLQNLNLPTEIGAANLVIVLKNDQPEKLGYVTRSFHAVHILSRKDLLRLKACSDNAYEYIPIACANGLFNFIAESRLLKTLNYDARFTWYRSFLTPAS